MDAVVVGEVNREQYPNCINVPAGHTVQVLDASQKELFMVEHSESGEVGFLPSSILSYDSQDGDQYFELNSDFVAQSSTHITCLLGDKVKLIRKVNDHWWVIQTKLGAQGQVPAKQLQFCRPQSQNEAKVPTSGVRFKKAASKVLMRAPSVKGLKASRTTLMTTSSKLKDQIAPKRKTSKHVTDPAPNIPAAGEKNSGWGFVKNKLLNGDGKKVKHNPKNETPQFEEPAPSIRESKLDNSTPSKPPRRNKRSSATGYSDGRSTTPQRDEINTTASRDSPGVAHKKILAPARPGSDGEGFTGPREDGNGLTEPAEEVVSTPRVTPRSGDVSLNESCVWDSYTEMHADELRRAEIKSDGLTLGADDVAIVTEAVDIVGTVGMDLNLLPSPEMTDNTNSELYRQSSTDLSNMESFSDVFDSLPDPPTPGTFSPARYSSTPGRGNLNSCILSPTAAGSTQTVLHCSSEDLVGLISLPSDSDSVDPILNDTDLDDILKRPVAPTRQKCGGKVQEQESGLDLSVAPEPPTGVIRTPTKKPKPCMRGPSSVSQMSDISSVSEAPSLSGTKSGIHYFAGDGKQNDDVGSLQSSVMSELKTANSEISSRLDEEDKSEPISLGSHPKWDDVARKAREKMKAKKDDDIKKEQKKKTWFSRGQKDSKEGKTESFVKRKEIDEVLDSTNSSCNTLSNESELKTDSVSAVPGLRPPLPRKKKLQRQKTIEGRPGVGGTESASFYTAQDSLSPGSSVTRVTPISRVTSASGTLGSDTDHTTMSSDVLGERKEGTDLTLSRGEDMGDDPGREASEIMSPDIETPDCSTTEPEIMHLLTPPAKTGMSCDPLSLPDSEGLVVRRVTSSGTPASSDTHVTQDTPTNEEDEALVAAVLSNTTTSSANTDPGLDKVMSPETRLPPIRPSNLSLPPDEALDMSANNTLSFVFTGPPRQNAFTVTVEEGHSTIKVCGSPKLSPERPQGSSPAETDDEVFQQEEVDGAVRGPSLIQDDPRPEVEVRPSPEEIARGGRMRSSESDIVLAVEQAYRAEMAATPPSGGKKRKSRETADQPSYLDDIPSPQPTPLSKFYSPPKMPRNSQYDISPTSRADDAPIATIASPTSTLSQAPSTLSQALISPHPHAAHYQYPPSHTLISPPPLPSSAYSTLEGPSRRPTTLTIGDGTSPYQPLYQSLYEELSITNGAPVVNTVKVLLETDEEEGEGGTSGGRKVRKQFSVHCDGRENLRVADTPKTTPKSSRRRAGISDSPPTTTPDQGGGVETDSAMRHSPPASDRTRGSPASTVGTLCSVKVPQKYSKAFSFPPNQDRNMMNLAVDEPPPSAPAHLQPSAPPQTPMTAATIRSIYAVQQERVYAEPSPNQDPMSAYHPGAPPCAQPPPLPSHWSSKFGEGKSPQNAHSPARSEVPVIGYHQSSRVPAHKTQLYPSTEPPSTQKLSGTSDNDEGHAAPSAAAPPSVQSCGVQTRNVRVNTETPYYANYSSDAKSKGIIMRMKKALGFTPSKKKMKVNVERDPDQAGETSYTSHQADRSPVGGGGTSPRHGGPGATPPRPPSLVRTQAEVTAHISTISSAPARPTAPQPTPEPYSTVQYEPETKPSRPSEAPYPSRPADSLYPPLPCSTSLPSPPPVSTSMSPAQFQTQIFGTAQQAAVPFPNAGLVPNVPFMWFPFGVPAGQPALVPGSGMPPPAQGIPPQHAAPLPITNQQARRRPQGDQHDCVDPTILSQDLIRHVKRSCGLNSSRSRTAARAIIQCLEDSISDTTKIQLLSEVLTAMDAPYRARREEDPQQRRTKRTRVYVDEDGCEVVRNHSCKRALREEKILMKYLQQVLEILEEMSESPDKENETFHMYFNLANRLLDTMYNKVAHKHDPARFPLT